MIDITLSEHPVNASALDDFEKRYEIKLADQYKSFLLKNNGGLPSRKYFKFLIDEGPYTESLIQRFLALYDGDNYNLERTYGKFLKLNSSDAQWLLPIAEDPGGNLICLNIKNNLGGVYFWDHEIARDSEGQHSINLISYTFEGFVEGLYNPKEEHINAVVDRSLALANNDLISLNKYIDKFGLEVRNDAGLTLLEEATMDNNLTLVDYLLSRGAELKGSYALAERGNKILGGYGELLNLLNQYKR